MVNTEDANSKSLAAQVVIYRTLGLNKELAQECMQELGKRRAGGDNFDYEAFIEDEVKKIPEIKVETPNIFNLLSKIK